MGIGPFKHSKSSYDSEKYRKGYTAPVERPFPNPDPENYKIIKALEIKELLVIKIRYPDCTNYEGEKILVYRNVRMVDLLNQGSIDPHFSENKKFHSPMARFVPTEEGFKMAVWFCENCQ